MMMKSVFANFLVFGGGIFIFGGLIQTVHCGFGGSQYHSGAGNSAASEIRANQGVARWSAQSAVANSVGRDYANQLGTTAQYVNQFTAPVTKQQANEAFNQVRYQQQGSLVSAALANAAPAINRGAQTAAKQNFDQAYAAAEGNRLSGSFHDAQAQQMAYLAGSALAAQQIQAQQAAHYADAAKTRQTQTNADAIQAIQGISSVDRGASYGK